MPGWPPRRFDRRTVAVFALVLIVAAVAFGVWATLAGNSGVFGRLTGLVGVCLLVLVVVIAVVGLFARVQPPLGTQLPSPDTVIAPVPVPDSSGQDQAAVLPLLAAEIPEPAPEPPEDPVAELEAVRAGDQGELCAGVLKLMSVLSAAGIRRDLVHAAGRAGTLGEGHGTGTDVAVVDGALNLLAERLLVFFSPDSPVVIAHRPVLRVVRDQLAEQERLVTTCRDAAAVLEAQCEALAGSPDRHAVRDVPRQVTALQDVVAGLTGEPDAELAGSLLRLQGWALFHLNALGDSAQQAIAIGEPLIAAQERILGPDHTETLAARNNLANAYQAAGRTDDAIALHEQVLADRERVLGADHSDTQSSRRNLAAARRASGPVGEAIALHEQALADRERELGSDHPDTLASRNNLALAFQTAGRTDEAIALHQKALADRERVLGADHPATLNSRSNLAVAYQAAGRMDEAIALHEQVLADRERVLGADHPDTQSSRNNLAAARRTAGQADETNGGPSPANGTS